MASRTLPLTEPLYRYLVETSLREPPILARLREETARLGEVAGMQISPEQGQFMALLARLIGARTVLEIGTFTGYSSLVVALALPSEARIVACDVSDRWTAIAQRYWAEAGVGERIELRLGPAVDTLARLAEERGPGSFDLAFVDADKANYRRYYESALTLLRPGGLILVDNMLWGGSVADPQRTDPDTVAIRELNQRLRADERVDFSLVPIGDGLALARKR